MVRKHSIYRSRSTGEYVRTISVDSPDEVIFRPVWRDLNEESGYVYADALPISVPRGDLERDWEFVCDPSPPVEKVPPSGSSGAAEPGSLLLRQMSGDRITVQCQQCGIVRVLTVPCEVSFLMKELKRIEEQHGGCVNKRAAAPGGCVVCGTPTFGLYCRRHSRKS